MIATKRAASQRGPHLAREAFHRFEYLALAQTAEVKGQADMGDADYFNDLAQNARAGFGAAEDAAAVAYHRVVFQVVEDSVVGLAFARIEVKRCEGKDAPTLPVVDHLGMRLRVVIADVNRVHD